MRIHYNKDTEEILGFYSNDDKNVPEPNVVVNANQYNKAISNNDTHINYKDLSTYKKETPLSLENAISIILGEVDKELDNKANEFGFDHFLNAMTYLAIPNKFQDIAKALFMWRDKIFASLENTKQEVISGKLPINTDTIDNILKNLPKFEAPKD
nr:MAG TPA: hypothetical protein [Caudoviricetes sp.]